MRSRYCSFGSCLVMTSVLLSVNPALSAGPPSRSARVAAKIAVDSTPRTVSLIEAARAGTIDVSAAGSEDGRMTLAVTNRSRSSLKVVLPPGLIATGATGQFAGVGGIGGGIGGIGGGMGGANMGMGGMGGGMNMGMGGMNGGMNNRGGMTGGMSSSGTMPAQMGMIMVGRLIMTLVGERQSWNFASLTTGGMGMGMNMGGLAGGGMANGGGLGANRFGEGFRSLPPVGMPFATIAPGQTRELPTRLISLDPPRSNVSTVTPLPGEPLRLDDISQIHPSARTQAAVEALSQAKAPLTIAQLVIWNVSSEMDWPTIARVSKGWANTHELTLAKTFAESINSRESSPSRARLFYEIKARDSKSNTSADELASLLQNHSYLGMKTAKTIPGKPMIPAISCRIIVEGDTADVVLAQSDADANTWTKAGTFSLTHTKNGWDGNALAREIIDRLVTTRVVAGPRIKGKSSYRLEIQNRSPLVLNSVAIGVEHEADGSTTPTLYQAIALPPERKLVFPIGETNRHETRVLAADLSSL